MGSKSDALRPEVFSLGNKVQITAIRWNNSKKHPIAGMVGGRVYAILLKPIARIADVSLHIILGVGKIVVGVTITAPISFIARLVRGHGIETNWTAKQGVFHLGYATLYFVDIFVSPVVNLISPDIYPAKKIMDLQAKLDAQNAANADALAKAAAVASAEAVRVQEEHDLRLRSEHEENERTCAELEAELQAAQERRRCELERLRAERTQEQAALETLYQTELERLRQQLAAYQTAAENEEGAMLKELKKTETFLRTIPAPPPPPPVRPATPRAGSPSKAPGGEVSPSAGGKLVSGISSETLGAGRETLKKQVQFREYVWSKEKHRLPDDPYFRIWAGQELKNVAKHAALVKVLSDNLAVFKTEGKDYYTVSKLLEAMQNVEEAAIEKEEKLQASALDIEDDNASDDDDWDDDESPKSASTTSVMGLMGASVIASSDVDYAKDTDELIAVLEDRFAKKYAQIERSIQYLQTNLAASGTKRAESKDSRRASDETEAQEARVTEVRSQVERASNAAKIKAAKDFVREFVWEKMKAAEKQQFVSNHAPRYQVIDFTSKPAFAGIEPHTFLRSCKPARAAEILAALRDDQRYSQFSRYEGELQLE